MGGRFWLGIAILVLFLALGLTVTFTMQSVHAPAEAALQTAAQEALGGNFENAVASANRAYQRWLTYRNFTASVADHGPMDDVETLFAEMQVYAQAGEVPHFAACCAQLQVLLKAVAEAHSPAWWNFL